MAKTIIVDEHVAAIAPVESLRCGAPIGDATAFWYEHDGRLYLVTNRHVVFPEKEGERPDELRLHLHVDEMDLRHNADYVVPLYENSTPSWLEHPVHRETVDVVAIPVDTRDVRQRFYTACFIDKSHVPEGLDVPLGADVQILGYPLRFRDHLHNLPIARKGSIASTYPLPFNGHPIVLCDARLHRGMSGSPVLTAPTNLLHYRNGSIAQQPRNVTFLVGVNSAMIPGDYTPEKDEPLGLNVAWYADLIPEIIGQ